MTFVTAFEIVLTLVLLCAILFTALFVRSLTEKLLAAAAATASADAAANANASEDLDLARFAMRSAETLRRRAVDAEDSLTALQQKYDALRETSMARQSRICELQDAHRILEEQKASFENRANRAEEQLEACILHIQRQSNRLFSEGLSESICDPIEKNLPRSVGGPMPSFGRGAGRPATTSIGLVDLNPSPVPRCRTMTPSR